MEYKIGQEVPVFEAYLKSGERVIVDDRTFDPEIHSRTAPAAARRSKKDED